MSGSTEASKPTIVVHHLEDSRSQRILWLLEELEVPYEVKKYKRTPQRLAPKELLDVHPLGKSPVITDGDVTLAESGAIVEYLIAKHGGANPKVNESGWVDNLYCAYSLRGRLVTTCPRPPTSFRLIPQRSPALIRPLVKRIFTKLDETLNAPELERHGKLIESHLEKTQGWFAGGEHPTSADYMMSFTLEILLNRAPEFAGSNVKEYVKRIQDRPAYKRALEKGGEYAYLIK
ncbi:glutathione S-transferase [Flammula alnicola]|nr:glutathione S-transferase [Flammula alnicola]